MNWWPFVVLIVGLGLILFVVMFSAKVVSLHMIESPEQAEDNKAEDGIVPDDFGAVLPSL